MLNEGIYEQIINNKLRPKIEELRGLEYSIGTEPIDVEEARKILSAYISEVTRKALKMIRENGENDAILNQIETCNDIIETLAMKLDDEEFKSLKIEENGEILTHIYSKMNQIKEKKVIRPVTPLSQSSLFTGSISEPDMMSELKKEILSSNSIDFLISFVKWSGLRLLLNELKEFTENGGKLRVITTTYMGATDPKAILELSQLKNTEVKISYDIERTRLHAKAYFFKRESGFTTAYIGSSNLSNAAMTSGLEWNLKVTEKDSFDVIQKCEATFESYWNDKEFKTFNSENEEDLRLLEISLKKNQIQKEGIQFNFDIIPYNYQKEILEALKAEREIFGRTKNLLVAATGVGKTVISAFDYKYFKKENPSAKLLFVAHREEILEQSLATFRAILKDNNFGEIHVGKYTATNLDHLFISIQSFNSLKLDEKTESDYYDYIIVDEFHHAAAPSYQKLLKHYKPKILLGLTATPERMDGQNVLEHFENTIAAEMRLKEAIDRKLLSPFQYFCITDSVDLSQLKWTKGSYDVSDLNEIYVNDKSKAKQRANDIITSLDKYITDINDVKGLAFCASVEHAIFMSDFFNFSNIPSIALHANSTDEERKTAKDKLRNGEIKFICVRDLYNEGVDIPEVNTVLFLRPTESLTIFIQQLGRGLRLSEDKECLTVLDFVAQAHKNYNFQEKFQALVGKSNHSIEYFVENGFSNLPKGCFIQLEKQAQEYILRNIKDSKNTRKFLIHRIKYFKQDTGKELTLSNFLTHYNLKLSDFYGPACDRTLRRMMVDANIKEDFECENEIALTKRLSGIFKINSVQWLKFLIHYIENKPKITSKTDQMMLNMLYYTIYQSKPEKEGFVSIEDGIWNFLKCEEIKEEVLDILKYNYEQIDFIPEKNTFSFDCPLDIHCSYSMAQVMAAFDYYNEENRPPFREGVKYFEDKKLDIFFITLNKSEKDFSPSTLYEDYAINENLFHWQSQSRTKVDSTTGQRYINHKKTGNKIALFVREYKKEENYTATFTFLGECEYISHSGSEPISFVWKLENEIPPKLLENANKTILID
ncbi:DUF3427 domain-containing protein [Methanimicrococcus blatticola]|uniref:Superfamily II DNA or RNA helicase n=1 Tax=Methanimicrococcus blatticola TaxID=91560 RepID=A0A484F6Y0_9EURY|nr:DUF3427 domain-containing protein [Methanimicrococcus blatticola]MBZ3935453.1 DUF3427 domain-containing protein [Methanimicrococcus blatticola]MCC2509097.1 DUF3427 domain-containing protein [Methanimicrococcus blatticola]TDQ69533.1 superfamily II DNA or RNA helicase [Methanimicrococcus blatticola]